MTTHQCLGTMWVEAWILPLAARDRRGLKLISVAKYCGYCDNNTWINLILRIENFTNPMAQKTEENRNWQHLIWRRSHELAAAPPTETPASPTACMPWLPFLTTSRGDMRDPSLDICHVWGSAASAGGANVTQRACHNASNNLSSLENLLRYRKRAFAEDF